MSWYDGKSVVVCGNANGVAGWLTTPSVCSSMAALTAGTNSHSCSTESSPLSTTAQIGNCASVGSLHPLSKSRVGGPITIAGHWMFGAAGSVYTDPPTPGTVLSAST